MLRVDSAEILAKYLSSLDHLKMGQIGGPSALKARFFNPVLVSHTMMADGSSERLLTFGEKVTMYRSHGEKSMY
jgi:hypothetical protein